MFRKERRPSVWARTARTFESVSLYSREVNAACTVAITDNSVRSPPAGSLIDSTLWPSALATSARISADSSAIKLISNLTDSARSSLPNARIAISRNSSSALSRPARNVANAFGSTARESSASKRNCLKIVLASTAFFIDCARTLEGVPKTKNIIDKTNKAGAP